MADVREVPAQRRHELRHLRALVGVGHRIEQAERAAARTRRARRRSRVLVTTSDAQRSAASRLQSSSRSSAGHAAAGDEAVEELVGGGDGRGVGARAARARRSAAVEAPPRRGARARGRASPSRAAAVPAVAHAGASPASPHSAAARVVEQRRGDRDRDRPPLLGERVDHAQLEPAARPHRREQRGEVVGEVVERRPAERVAVGDPPLERRAVRAGRRCGRRRRGSSSPARRARTRSNRGAPPTSGSWRRAESVRPGSMACHTAARVDRKPEGRPTASNGEFAKHAVSTGPRSWARCQRASIS